MGTGLSHRSDQPCPASLLLAHCQGAKQEPAGCWRCCVVHKSPLWFFLFSLPFSECSAAVCGPTVLEGALHGALLVLVWGKRELLASCDRRQGWGPRAARPQSVRS